MKINNKNKQPKAIIDKNKLIILLNGRTLTWLYKQMQNMGINISYNSFYSNLTGRVEIKLIYAMLICRILNCSIENLFYLEI